MCLKMGYLFQEGENILSYVQGVHKKCFKIETPTKTNNLEHKNRAKAPKALFSEKHQLLVALVA
jgi:hypothetical protein